MSDVRSRMAKLICRLSRSRGSLKPVDSAMILWGFALLALIWSPHLFAGVTPAISEWDHGWIVCNGPNYGYATEAEAVDVGLRASYPMAFSSGCGAPRITPRSPWGTAEQQTWGACGSTNRYPWNLLIFEWRNARDWLIEWNYGEDCDQATTGAITIPRQRTIGDCPPGTVWVHPESCQPIPGVIDPAKNNEGMCPGNGSNPIHSALGFKHQCETDIELHGGLGFKRYYSSWEGSEDSRIGNHWRDSYLSRIELSKPFVNDRSVVAYVYRPAGNRYTFTESNSGTWIPDRDIRLLLNPIFDASGQLEGWILSGADETRERFDTDGKLMEIAWANGDRVELTYDGERLATVSNRQGRSLVFEYALNSSRIAALVDSAGGRISYSYRADGALLSVTRQDGSLRQYLYEDTRFPFALTGIVDESGKRFATWAYDAQGRAISSHHGDDGLMADFVQLTYNNDGSTTALGALGNARTMHFSVNMGVARVQQVSSPCQGCGENRIAHTIYDQFGHRHADFEYGSGGMNLYAHDTRGKEVKRIEKHGRPEQRTVDTVWHPTLQRRTSVQVRNASGELQENKTWALNDRGQVIAACEYEVPGVTEAAYTCGSMSAAPSGIRQTLYSYCEQQDVAQDACPSVGLLRQVDGPRVDVADITSYDYYAEDHLSCSQTPSDCPYRKGDLSKITDAAGHATEFLAYDAGGRVIVQRDANGLVNEFIFSNRGWLITSVVRGLDGQSAGDDAFTHFEYTATGLINRVTQPDGAITLYSYDTAHRLTDIVDTNGNRISYTLNAAGDRTREEVFDPQQQLARAVHRDFDTLSRLTTTKNAANLSVNSFAYDVDRLVSTTDALARVSQQEWDGLGRLVRSIANQTGTASERAETRFAYDSADRLRSVVDPNGLTTTYTYNGLGDLTSLQSADTGTSGYGYDEAGNRTSQTDARGITLGYSYDVLNRLTRIDPPTVSQAIAFDYDSPSANCGLDEEHGLGRLARMSDESGETRYCYDQRGQLVRRESIPASGPARTVLSDYTASGQLDSLVYPSGATVRYARDAQGRIVQVLGKPSASASEVPLVSSLEYLPFGPATAIAFANGRVLSRQFDLDYRLTGIADNAANDPFLIELDLDRMGNVTAIDEQQGASLIARSYRYDGQYRLNGIDAGSTEVEGFAYDATGNRIQHRQAGTPTAYTLAANSHRLASVGSEARSYSSAGQTTAIGTARSFVYDDHGRLREAHANGQLQAGYRYNGRGERVLKLHPTDAAQNIHYVYADDGRLLGEYRQNGERIAEYVWADDTLIAIYADHDGSNHQYVLADHLGTPRAVVHPTRNAIVWRWDLNGSGFGQHAANEDPDGDSVAYRMNLRYPGQYFDAESGLHYNYFRDYDPSTGRYVESDPIGLEGGISTFSYAESSPLLYVDPLGLAACSKGGRKNIGTEGFTKKSDAKDVEQALKEAMQKRQHERVKALRALLKVIKRGGSMGVAAGVPGGVFRDLCLQGDSYGCASLCKIDPEDELCICSECEA